MNRISSKLQKNDYVQLVGANSIFSTAVTDLLNRYKIYNNKINYLHLLYNYGPWDNTENLDFLRYINPRDLSRLRRNQLYLLFDISTEGFSPSVQTSLFETLYYNCEKYSIDPRHIIYMSSNLRDEDNIINFSNTNNKVPFNVLSFPMFEHTFLPPKIKVNSLLNRYKLETGKNFNGKYFSSLSRLNRLYRMLSNFMLFNSEIFDKALVSHGKVDKCLWNIDHNLLQLGNQKQIKRWMKSLPFTIDQTDFKKNWAIDTPYEKIYTQTLFHIVNETEVLNFQNTSMFYSEKTFRAIRCMIPFVIYGQPGTNKYLTELGYKLYDDWFDYSFDDIEDPIERYKKILEIMTNLCKELDSMSYEQKINWRFKNEEILVHNYNTLFTNQYTETKFRKFFNNL